MSKQKSLGQIAHEAAPIGYLKAWEPWEQLRPSVRFVHEHVAQAVARVVKRRMKGKS